MTSVASGIDVLPSFSAFPKPVIPFTPHYTRLRNCILTTCKHFRPSLHGQAYVAFLAFNPEQNSIQRYWVRPTPLIWDDSHQTYWTEYRFAAPLGISIEARLISKKQVNQREYFRVTRWGQHLHRISRQDAFRIAFQHGHRRSHIDYPSGHYISPEVRYLVWERDAGRCVQCGSREHLEFDHIIPVVKGGNSAVENIQVLCRKCNRKKKDQIK